MSLYRIFILCNPERKEEGEVRELKKLYYYPIKLFVKNIKG